MLQVHGKSVLETAAPPPPPRADSWRPGDWGAVHGISPGTWNVLLTSWLTMASGSEPASRVPSPCFEF